MVTDLFDRRPKQDALKKVEVLGHHRDHVNIPTFGKTLNRGFQFCTGKGVETMLYIHKIVL